jgi:hypothetical protein
MEFVCFVLISEETENFALQNIERSVYITEFESVYSAVRADLIYKTDTFRLWKVNIFTRIFEIITFNLLNLVVS